MTAANCRCVKRVSGGNMATWNSRGLRGSTLEEFINRTNEIYQENGLALIQKIPTPITPINIDKQTRHITLARRARWTISVPYREYRSVLMQKNVIRIPFHLPIFMNIRLRSWRTLKNREGYLFSCSVLRSGMSSTICAWICS